LELPHIEPESPPGLEPGAAVVQDMRREEEELPPFQASQGTSVQAEVEGQSHQLHQRPWSRHRRAELQAFPAGTAPDP